MTFNKTRLFKLPLWLLVTALFFQERCAVSTLGTSWNSQYLNRLDEGSVLIYAYPQFSVEKTSSGQYVKKIYYPETMQLTHYQSYLDENCSVLNGRYREWLDDGTLFSEGNFKSGLAVGQWTYYSIMNNYFETGGMRNHQRDGLWVATDSTGRKKAEFNYREGKRHGAFVLYDGDKMKAEGSYADDKMITTDEYDPGGNMQAQQSSGMQIPPSYPCSPSVAQNKNCGEASLIKFLASTIRYPKSAREKNISGHAIMSFVVGKDGSISDIKCHRGVCDAIKAECIRVLQAMPKWNPGMVNDEPVKVRFTLPVSFRLD